MPFDPNNPDNFVLEPQPEENVASEPTLQESAYDIAFSNTIDQDKLAEISTGSLSLATEGENTITPPREETTATDSETTTVLDLDKAETVPSGKNVAEEAEQDIPPTASMAESLDLDAYDKLTEDTGDHGTTERTMADLVEEHQPLNLGNEFNKVRGPDTAFPRGTPEEASPDAEASPLAEETPDAPKTDEEKTAEAKAVAELVATIERKSDAEKMEIGKRLNNAGYRLERWKNEGWRSIWNGLAKAGDEGGTWNRFMGALGEQFGRKAERNQRALEAMEKLEREGKSQGIIKNLTNVGYLTGNIVKYGRLLVGAATPAGWAMMGAMAGANIAEAGKETALTREAAQEKTRISAENLTPDELNRALEEYEKAHPDADMTDGETREKAFQEFAVNKAADEAWTIYHSAMRAKGLGVAEGDTQEAAQVKEKAAAALIGSEDLKKAYEENVAATILPRLERMTEKTGNPVASFMRGMAGKFIGHVAESTQKRIQAIDSDPSLTQEEKQAKKELVLTRFGRGQLLKDIDRMLSQQGALDTLGATLWATEKAAKGAVYALSVQALHKAYETLSNLAPTAWDDAQRITSEIITHANAAPRAGIGTAAAGMAQDTPPFIAGSNLMRATENAMETQTPPFIAGSNLMRATEDIIERAGHPIQAELLPHEVASGETLTGILKDIPELDGRSDAEVAALIKSLSPEELRTINVSSSNADLIRVGERLDLNAARAIIAEKLASGNLSLRAASAIGSVDIPPSAAPQVFQYVEEPRLEGNYDPTLLDERVVTPAETSVPPSGGASEVSSETPITLEKWDQKMQGAAKAFAAEHGRLPSQSELARYYEQHQRYIDAAYANSLAAETPRGPQVRDALWHGEGERVPAGQDAANTASSIESVPGARSPYENLPEQRIMVRRPDGKMVEETWVTMSDGRKVKIFEQTLPEGAGGAKGATEVPEGKGREMPIEPEAKPKVAQPETRPTAPATPEAIPAAPHSPLLEEALRNPDIAKYRGHPDMEQAIKNAEMNAEGFNARWQGKFERIHMRTNAALDRAEIREQSAAARAMARNSGPTISGTFGRGTMRPGIDVVGRVGSNGNVDIGARGTVPFGKGKGGISFDTTPILRRNQELEEIARSASAQKSFIAEEGNRALAELEREYANAQADFMRQQKERLAAVAQRIAESERRAASRQR